MTSPVLNVLNQLRASTLSERDWYDESDGYGRGMITAYNRTIQTIDELIKHWSSEQNPYSAISFYRSLLYSQRKENEALQDQIKALRDIEAAWLKENGPGGWIDTLRKDFKEAISIMKAEPKTLLLSDADRAAICQRKTDLIEKGSVKWL